MALLFLDSFGRYGAAGELAQRWDSSGAITLLPTGGPRGGQCVRLDSNTSSGTYTDDAILSRAVPSVPATIIFGFNLYIESQYASAGNQPLFSLHSHTTVHQCTFEIETNLSTGKFMLALRQRTNGTQIAIPSAGAVYDMDPGTWYHFECKVLINNSGSVEVNRNGVPYINQAGIDTYFSGTVGCGRIEISSGAYSWGPIMRIADFWIADTTGSVNNDLYGHATELSYHLPIANGSTQNFTPSSGGSNLLMVDEVGSHDADATKVTSTTNAHRDLYGVTAFTDTRRVIHAVQPVAMAARDDGTGPQNLKLVQKGTAAATSANVALATTFGPLAAVFPTNPDTAVSWTKTQFNAAEFGFEAAT